MKRRVTIRHVFELVLRLKQICNFDPATGASSKMERLEADLEEVRRQRPEGDRIQPVGADARRSCGSGCRRSARPSITARSPRAGATQRSNNSATTRVT